MVPLLFCIVTGAAAEQPVWVAYGDSLTTDLYNQDGKPVRIKGIWPDLVAQAVGTITMVNAGKAGATTDYALTQLEAQVLSHGPKIVFIMFGINDQHIKNNGQPDGYRVPPARYRQNLTAMVRRIHAMGAHVVLMTNRPLVQGPGAPDHDFYLDRYGDGGALYTIPGKVKGSIRMYNDIVQQVAEKHGAFVIDVWQVVVNAGGGSDDDKAILSTGIDMPPPKTDGVHLGVKGHALVARTVLNSLPALQAWIQKSPPPRSLAAQSP